MVHKDEAVKLARREAAKDASLKRTYARRGGPRGRKGQLLIRRMLKRNQQSL
jgi:hypothetical protein